MATAAAAEGGGGRGRRGPSRARGRRTALVSYRVGLVAAAAILSVVGGLDGAAAWLAPTRPLLAARLAPWNARAAVAAAQALVEAGASPADPRVRRLADAALSRDATIPGVIELRALQAGAAGDHAREARLFELSDRISRRSLPTRLWLIQRSVDRGDVPGALEDFDIALRTSAHAPPLLFPVLTRAAADPQLALPVARILDRPSDWRVMFLDYAAAHDPAATARVVLAMGDRRAVLDDHVDQQLIAALVGVRDFTLARQVHDTLRAPGHGAAEVRDPGFGDQTADYPFGWLLSDRGDAGARRGAVGGRPALIYRSEPGGEGQVARQLLVLPPGAYSLETRTAQAGDAASAPVWTLTCGEPGGRQIALLAQPAAPGAASRTAFQVAPECTGQWLALNLRPSDIAERSGAIASVTVERRTERAAAE